MNRSVIKSRSKISSKTTAGYENLVTKITTYETYMIGLAETIKIIYSHSRRYIEKCEKMI